MNWLRLVYWTSLGMKMKTPRGLGKLHVTWPHQVFIGKNALLEDGVSFKVDGPWDEATRIKIGDNVFVGRNVEFNITSSIEIGNAVLIATGCVFVDHDHGTSLAGIEIRHQTVTSSPIVIGDNVWIGASTVVLKGVTIGRDAIVGAGSVVTRDVPSGQVWGGVPARFIRHMFKPAETN